MARVLKTADVRRAELLAAAGDLFQSVGYAQTSVEAIIRQAKVAKGTFYYYFDSKQAILEAFVTSLVAKLLEISQAIAEDPVLGAVDKLGVMLAAQRQLYEPKDRELQERINLELIKSFAPILATVVTQGSREGVFAVDDPLAMMQFMLTGSLFLFDNRLFDWSPPEYRARMTAQQIIMEKSFGAKPGTFSFLTDGF